MNKVKLIGKVQAWDLQSAGKWYVKWEEIFEFKVNLEKALLFSLSLERKRKF